MTRKSLIPLSDILEYAKKNPARGSDWSKALDIHFIILSLFSYNIKSPTFRAYASFQEKEYLKKFSSALVGKVLEMGMVVQDPVLEVDVLITQIDFSNPRPKIGSVIEKPLDILLISYVPIKGNIDVDIDRNSPTQTKREAPIHRVRYSDLWKHEYFAWNEHNKTLRMPLDSHSFDDFLMSTRINLLEGVNALGLSDHVVVYNRDNFKRRELGKMFYKAFVGQSFYLGLIWTDPKDSVEYVLVCVDDWLGCEIDDKGYLSGNFKNANSFWFVPKKYIHLDNKEKNLSDRGLLNDWVLGFEILDLNPDVEDEVSTEHQSSDDFDWGGYFSSEEAPSTDQILESVDCLNKDKYQAQSSDQNEKPVYSIKKFATECQKEGEKGFLFGSPEQIQNKRLAANVENAFGEVRIDPEGVNALFERLASEALKPQIEALDPLALLQNMLQSRVDGIDLSALASPRLESRVQQLDLDALASALLSGQVDEIDLNALVDAKISPACSPALVLQALQYVINNRFEEGKLSDKLMFETSLRIIRENLSPELERSVQESVKMLRERAMPAFGDIMRYHATKLFDRIPVVKFAVMTSFVLGLVVGLGVFLF